MSDPNTLFNQAYSAFQNDDLARAEKRIQKLIKIMPQNTDVLRLAVYIAHKSGAWKRIIDRIERFEKKSPVTDVSVKVIYGTALRQTGRIEDAIRALKAAKNIEPSNADISFNLGNAQRDAGDLTAAEQSYGDAIALQPNSVDALVSRSTCRGELADFSGAIDDAENALRLSPNDPKIMIVLSQSLISANRYADALGLLDSIHNQSPKYGDALTLKGQALSMSGDYEKATICFETAGNLLPGNPHVLKHTAFHQMRIGDYESAELKLKHIVESTSGDGDAQLALGSLMIAQENPDGWPLLEGTYHQALSHHPNINLPNWNGEPIDGKRIFVWADQGVGDQVLFVTMVDELIKQGAIVSLSCDERLIPFFSRTLSKITYLPRWDQSGFNLDTNAFDFQCALTRLTWLLRPDFFSRDTPNAALLAADPDKVNELRNRYAQPEKHLIGIAWRSGNAARPERNAKLENWGPLLSRSDCQFVSLQYGDIQDDLKRAHDLFGTDIIVDEDIDQMSSIDDFAAQIASLDMVVSISNTTVHVAGAIGQETMIILPMSVDWRYGLQRQDSPWYSNVSFFRQHIPGDWAEVISRVSASFGALP